MQSPAVGLDSWTIRVAAELVTWQQTYKEAQALVPPPRFTEVHEDYLTMLALLDSASYDISSGIDNGDFARVETGAAKIARSGEMATDIAGRVRGMGGVSVDMVPTTSAPRTVSAPPTATLPRTWAAPPTATASRTLTAPPTVASRTSITSAGDRDCGDFASQAQAQAFFEAAGGPAVDPHRLDRDRDGIACEST